MFVWLNNDNNNNNNSSNNNSLGWQCRLDSDVSHLYHTHTLFLLHSLFFPFLHLSYLAFLCICVYCVKIENRLKKTGMEP